MNDQPTELFEKENKIEDLEVTDEQSKDVSGGELKLGKMPAAPQPTDFKFESPRSSPGTN